MACRHRAPCAPALPPSTPRVGDRTESPSRQATEPRSSVTDCAPPRGRPQILGRTQVGGPLADATTRQRGTGTTRRSQRLWSGSAGQQRNVPFLCNSSGPSFARLEEPCGIAVDVVVSQRNDKRRTRAREDRSADHSPDLRLLSRSDRRHVVGDQARRVRHLRRRWVRGLGAVTGAHDRHQRRPGRRPRSSPATRTQAGTEAVVRLLWDGAAGSQAGTVPRRRRAGVLHADVPAGWREGLTSFRSRRVLC